MNIILMLIAHFVGDFFLQWSGLAGRKKEKFVYVLLHSLIYIIPFIILLLPVSNIPQTILWLCVILGSHIIIDWIKSMMIRNKSGMAVLLLFILDQVLHITVILLLSSQFTSTDTLGYFLFGHLSGILGFTAFKIGYFLLGLLLITKPLAVTNDHLRDCYSVIRNPDGNDDAAVNKAGYIIGILERIIVLVLCLYGQIGSIGLVLAAKSIARYKQLEDRKFAEKYLIGTLLSVLEAITISFLIIKLQ